VPACDVREYGRGSGGAAPLTLPCRAPILTYRPLARTGGPLALAGRLVTTPCRLAGLAAAVAVAVALTVLRAALLATV